MPLSLSFQNPLASVSRQEQLGLWIHKHPTTVKVIQVAAGLAGLGLLLTLPWTYSALGLASIGLGLSGLALSAAAGVSAYALDTLVPPHHEMKTHVYRPGKCPGGKLFYEGDVPILSLDMSNPYLAGKAQGLLCGPAIHRVVGRFDWVLHSLCQRPRAKELPHTLAAIRETVPKEYLEEIDGLSAGYNEWAQAHRIGKRITPDDILLIHLIPDSAHFTAGAFEQNSAPKEDVALVACSSLLDQDPQRGLVFARNMDWPSFGITGTYSLVIHRKHTSLQDTVEVAVPGFIGTLTGMNRAGLSLAMNVCPAHTTRIHGMPAAFYNRACLERCRSVKEVEQFTEDTPPLGPYHLTVADATEGKSIHLFQGNFSHTIRSWQKDHPLVTLNCRYHTQEDTAFGDPRQTELNRFFQTPQPLEQALSLPSVNNWLTTHRVVMEPRSKTMCVAFDNAFAGKAPLHNVPLDKLFSSFSACENSNARF